MAHLLTHSGLSFLDSSRRCIVSPSWSVLIWSHLYFGYSFCLHSVSVVNSFPSAVKSCVITGLASHSSQVLHNCIKWHLGRDFPFNNPLKMTRRPIFQLLHNWTVQTKGFLYVIATAEVLFFNLTSVYSLNLTENMATAVRMVFPYGVGRFWLYLAVHILKLLPNYRAFAFIFLELCLPQTYTQTHSFYCICIKIYLVYMRKCDIDICIIEHHHISCSR